ncbi:penicillin-binding protein activator [Sphingosinicella sp. BN140058]|uniref:penicillin-binding protein activator n=1 Tax=Sphingosinicella sp. BN140058 TaxID=1892855 RepID=UPI001011747F|nr:penicillin-binding protein activator [Sphingosinicella sp. BN140058]QAY75354.1 penicillin-binding protein activator [Sphingosinicella sp. BN140058]
MAEQTYRPQARRSFIALGASLIVLSLSACQLVPSAGPRRPPEPTRPETEEPELGPDTTTGLPQDADRHRIAVLVPLTGGNAGVGQSIANAANLALLDSGGDRIRITVYDTAKGAETAANQAVADGNRLFLGPLLAEDVRAAAPIASRARIPVVAFSNDASVAGAGTYLMGFTPAQSISRVVRYARSEGVERFAALTPAGVYGRRAGQAMIDAVNRGGGRLVGMQSFDRGIPGLRSAIVKLNTQGTWDAIVIADSGRTAITAAPTLRNGPSGSARILGTELWSTETDLGKTPGLRGAWYAAPSDAMFEQLRTRYRARYGANPYRLASLGYDAVLLAVRVGKTWRFGRPFPEGELRDRVGFTGIDGAFRFGAGGVAERALEVREVTATGTKVVSPAAREFD